MNRSSTCYLVTWALALFFAIATLTCGIVAMALNKWVYYQVPSSVAADNTLQSNTRWRGMFLECVQDGSASILSTYSSNVVFGSCFRLALGPSSTTLGQYVINLRAAFIGTFSAGVFLGLLGCILGLVVIGMWCCKKFPKSALLSYIVGAMLAIGTVCFAAALMLFHITLDWEKITAATDLTTIFYYWSTTLQQGTGQYYTASYYIAISAGASCILSAILFFFSTYCIYPREYVELETRTRHTGQVNSAYLGRDYEMMKDHPRTASNAPSVMQGYVDHKPVYPANDMLRSTEHISSGKNVYRVY